MTFVQTSFRTFRVLSSLSLLGLSVACSAGGGDSDGTGGGNSTIGGNGGPGSDPNGPKDGENTLGGGIGAVPEQPSQGKEETCVTLPDGTEECFCLRVAVIGTADSPANDSNATAFRDWLNTKSNAAVTILDPKDPMNPQPKPTLNAEFLQNYDVLILQLQGDSKTGPFWTYTPDEIAAVKAWVEAGGGIISLTGYNGMQAAAETGAVNALIGGVAGMTYGTNEVAVTSGETNYCWGNSVRVLDWLDDSIGYEVSAVGALHGYPVMGGTPVAKAQDGNVVGATAQVGDGFVFVWADEWVLFTNQWSAEDPNASQYTDMYNPCFDKRPEQVFQLPQFWYNALGYAGGNRLCFTIEEPTIVVR